MKTTLQRLKGILQKRRGILDIRALFAIGLGFVFFIFVAAIVFSMTSQTLSQTPVSNPQLNQSLAALLDTTPQVFNTIGIAFVIGALLTLALGAVLLYRYFTS